MSYKPCREGFVRNGDDPDLTEFRVVVISDSRPRKFQLATAIASANIAIKAIGLQEIGNDAVETTDFAGPLFIPRAVNMGNNKVTTVYLEMENMAIVMPNHLFLCERHLTPDKFRSGGSTPARLALSHYPTGFSPQGKTQTGVESQIVGDEEMGSDEDDGGTLYCMECGQPLTRRDDKCPWCGEYQ